MILCILPCDFCKLFVDPEKFSLRIHNGIGQRQFLDQMLLNLAVFGRKGNQLVDHLRTLSVIENCGCDHIDCKKQREPHSQNTCRYSSQASGWTKSAAIEDSSAIGRSTSFCFSFPNTFPTLRVVFRSCPSDYTTLTCTLATRYFWIQKRYPPFSGRYLHLFTDSK